MASYTLSKVMVTSISGNCEQAIVWYLHVYLVSNRHHACIVVVIICKALLHTPIYTCLLTIPPLHSQYTYFYVLTLSITIITSVISLRCSSFAPYSSSKSSNIMRVHIRGQCCSCCDGEICPGLLFKHTKCPEY